MIPLGHGNQPSRQNGRVGEEASTLLLICRNAMLTPEEERLCRDRAMAQWKESLKRTDLSERDRVLGAIEAYARQAYAIALMRDIEKEQTWDSGNDYSA
jgi:hypothetical protein